MTSLDDQIKWLDGHINHERLGPDGGKSPFLDGPERRLRRLGKLMALMDEPQKLYPSFHVTGTNGKTSTARMITALVLAQGLSVGTYTSPHLERLNERITVNDEPIDDFDFAEALAAIRLLEPMMDQEHGLEDLPSYFEILTAAAFRHFADAAVDVGVIEVGVGGTWDATNVVDGLVSVVTNIGLDHQGYLGQTKREIATHKAGIIKPKSIAVVGETDKEFMDIWDEREAEQLLIADRDFSVVRNEVAVGGRLLDIRTPRGVYSDVFLSLHGAYQAPNAAVAVAAAEAFFDQALAPEVIRDGLGSVSSPGRMEIVHRQPVVLLDGAHNVAGATALRETLDEEFKANPTRIYVIGMLRGHDPAEFMEALDIHKARLVIATTAPSPRGIAADVIAAAVKASGVPVVVVTGVGDAVKEAMNSAEDDELVVVTGSLYAVGAARTALLG